MFYLCVTNRCRVGVGNKKIQLGSEMNIHPSPLPSRLSHKLYKLYVFAMFLCPAKEGGFLEKNIRGFVATLVDGRGSVDFMYVCEFDKWITMNEGSRIRYWSSWIELG